MQASFFPEKKKRKKRMKAVIKYNTFLVLTGFLDFFMLYNQALSSSFALYLLKGFDVAGQKQK